MATGTLKARPTPGTFDSLRIKRPGATNARSGRGKPLPYDNLGPKTERNRGEEREGPFGYAQDEQALPYDNRGLKTRRYNEGAGRKKNAIRENGAPRRCFAVTIRLQRTGSGSWPGEILANA